MQVAHSPLTVNPLPQSGEEKTSSRKKGGGRKGGKGKSRGQEPDEDTVKSTCKPKFMAPDEVRMFVFTTVIDIQFCRYTAPLCVNST